MNRYWSCWFVRIYNAPDGWTRTTATPTFLLDSHIQAIRGEEHARKIVREITGPDTLDTRFVIHVTPV